MEIVEGECAVADGRGGPASTEVTVVLCDGHRCRALRDRTDTGVAHGEGSTLLGALRERVRRSRHAVLIRANCLGVCAQAPAALVIRRTAALTRAGAGTVFGSVESPGQVRELLEAVPVDTEGPAPAAGS